MRHPRAGHLPCARHFTIGRKVVDDAGQACGLIDGLKFSAAADAPPSLLVQAASRAPGAGAGLRWVHWGNAAEPRSFSRAAGIDRSPRGRP